MAHHWLMSMRGGEKTLEAIAEIFPAAPIYALAGRPGRLSDSLKSHPLRFSFLQNLPGSPRYFRGYLPLFPRAVRSLRIPDCDLLISSDANIMKGAPVPRKAKHICYCYSPPRYFWLMQDLYLRNLPLGIRPLVRGIFENQKRFDYQAAQTVDYFVAISRAVGRRIEKFYQRKTEAVIYPPVDVHLCHAQRQRESFYLVVSELVPYKRVDIAVESCTRLKKPLVVIGTGSEINRLKKIAGPHIVFMGWQSDETVREYMGKARAFLFPGEEDFGIAPVEAMASGAPVIAYGAGGVLDTVIDGKTGVYFSEQTVDSLCGAIESFEKKHDRFDTGVLVAQAAQFARDEFQKKFRSFLRNKLNLTD